MKVSVRPCRAKTHTKHHIKEILLVTRPYLQHGKDCFRALRILVLQHMTLVGDNHLKACPLVLFLQPVPHAIHQIVADDEHSHAFGQ